METAAAKKKKATSALYVVTAASAEGTPVGAWTNRDKAIRQSYETTGESSVQVFDASNGKLIETIVKG